jgi:hypothetical protein
MIAGWLKAGVIEVRKGFAPTDKDTPQGGIVWLILSNAAVKSASVEKTLGVMAPHGDMTPRVSIR